MRRTVNDGSWVTFKAMNEFKEMFPNLEPTLIATTLEKNDGNSERTLNELLSAV